MSLQTRRDVVHLVAQSSCRSGGTIGEHDTVHDEHVYSVVDIHRNEGDDHIEGNLVAAVADMHSTFVAAISI